MIIHKSSQSQSASASSITTRIKTTKQFSFFQNLYKGASASSITTRIKTLKFDNK